MTSADTAYTVAAIRCRESQRPLDQRLFDDPFARLFGTGGPEVEAATQRVLAVPFIEESTRLRTRFIDDELRAALAAGVGQVVLLGAGFDARGLRIAEIPACGARVYEIDFASQLDTKRALLAAGGVTLPPWVDCVISAGALLDSLSDAMDRLRDLAGVVMDHSIVSAVWPINRDL